MLSFLLLSVLSDGWYSASQQDLEIESQAGILLSRPGMRDLSLRITAPKAGGPYPLIVWSHGMYGSESGYGSLVDSWAKSGYVTIQPTHDDSLRYADAETRRSAMRGSLDNIGSAPQRPKDISLVLDSLDEITRKAPTLGSKIDRMRLGMGGHSFGAWTAQVVSGMSGRVGGLTAKDDRFQAFLVISPQGEGGNVGPSSFKTMKGPMMMISGDKDSGRGEWDPKVYRRQAFEGAAPGDKWLVWIKDAYHNFGGISGREGGVQLGGRLMGPSNPTHSRQVRTSSLAFWDATLKGRPEAKNYLKNKEIERTGGIALSSK